MSTGFDPFIQTDVETSMRGVNASAFLRWSFTYDAEEAPVFETLTLQMRSSEWVCGFSKWSRNRQPGRASTQLMEFDGDAGATRLCRSGVERL